MNRDYVRSAKPQRKRKPAARSNARQPARAPFPVLRALLAVALVLGFALFLYLIKGTAETPVTEGKEPPKAKPVPIEEQRPAKEKFDYMTLLENKEVNVDLPAAPPPPISASILSCRNACWPSNSCWSRPASRRSSKVAHLPFRARPPQAPPPRAQRRGATER